MKITVTPFHVKNIKTLAKEGAEVFILGNDNFANRLVSSFSELELREANDIIKSLNKELIISAYELSVPSFSLGGNIS